MPIFPSKEWAEQAIDLINADPESELAGEGWEGDFGIVVEAERGKLDRHFTVHVVPEAGRVRRFKVLRDPDELDELEPAYVARAPYSVWKALLLGQLDPIEALVKRRISVAGNVQPLIERARYKVIGDRVLAKLDTKFIDEG